MTLDKLLDGVRSVAVVCNQWGDTGKGKFSDYFSEWADIIARGTGGNNAGHTVVVNNEKRVFHLLPAGITYDSEGKTNILGNGMVLDLKVLNEELDALDKAGMTYNNLMISEDAHVILPSHVDIDRRKNKSMTNGGIGSTGRGIGPCYSDKISRTGIMIRDIYNTELLSAKLDKMIGKDKKDEKENMIESLRPYAERIRPFVRDTIQKMQDFYSEDKRILLEGAQGLLLSVEFGTYPYVTSSDPSLNGTASGVGLPATAVDLPLGIAKFPIMTRVGGGPFPTEFGGVESERYCNEDTGDAHKIKSELEQHGIPYTEYDAGVKYDRQDPAIMGLINSDDPVEAGIGYRLAAGEYGATTQRPRRVGRTDLAALKYAVGINGPNVILTKTDTARGAEFIELGTGYRQRDNFSRHLEELRNLDPLYKRFKGFNADISEAESFIDLPVNLQKAITFTESHSRCNVKAISVGPDRNETIICDH